MEVLKGFFNLITIAVVVLFGASLFLPSKWEVYKEVVIQAPPSEVFPFVHNLKKWHEWHKWVRAGGEMTYGDETEGEGAMQSRNAIRMEILESTRPNYLSYKVEIKNELAFTSDFNFQVPQVGTTNLIWRAFGDNGLNPVKKFYSIYYKYMLGKEFEESLVALRYKVENR